MKRQCECGNQADEYVFGLPHRCEPLPQPAVPSVADRSLVPSWVFTVPAEQPVLRDPYDMDDDERRG